MVICKQCSIPMFQKIVWFSHFPFLASPDNITYSYVFAFGASVFSVLPLSSAISFRYLSHLGSPPNPQLGPNAISRLLKHIGASDRTGRQLKAIFV